jgi:putative GTP pyrophosphokinase
VIASERERLKEDDVRQLDAYRRSFADAYEEIVGTIRDATQLDPTGRPAKSTTSIIEKLRRETIRLTQMQDIAGCRLVVRDVSAQDEVVERLKSALREAVIIDRRKQPRYGYRAVHIIATARGKAIEVQVRTELQHLWAQLSEKLSDVLDPTIKYGGGSPVVRDVLSGSSDNVAELEANELQLAEAEVLLGQAQRKGNAHGLQEQLLDMRERLASAKARYQEGLTDFIASIPAQKEQETE